MPDLARDIELADRASAALGVLADRLSALPPEDAFTLLRHLVATDRSVLTHVLCTGSEVARQQAKTNTWDVRLALALAFTANSLDDGALDIADALAELHAYSSPAGQQPPPRPVPRTGRRR
ncbi:hypothetical protein ACFY1V_13095 [Streptomyces sp. NPDC001255]|uniref:hypothetical protein n=1 Tax=Streptomyces sp. NPDC001255 TaxID=3364550 RepID=UPI0036BE081B